MGLEVLENRKIFVPTRIRTPDHPAGEVVSIHTSPQNFTLERAMKAQPWPIYPLKTNPVPTIQEAGWAPGPVLPTAVNLVPTPGLTPQNIHPWQVAIPTMVAWPTKY